MISIKKVLSKLVKTNEDSNYILVGNVGICWGTTTSQNQWSKAVTHPITFTSNPYVVCGVVADTNSVINVTAITHSGGTNKTSFNFNEITTAKTVNYIAIGFVDRGGF